MTDRSAPVPASDADKHWLLRKATIRRLWWVGGLVLALSVLAEFVVTMHGDFGADDTLGFNAWYGLLTCAAMVVGAKLLGQFLKRPDDYYDRMAADPHAQGGRTHD